MDGAELAALIKHLQYQRHLVDYTIVSAAAILIYDYALTLRLEIKYVWFSKWSYTKFLFLLIRYLSFVNVSIVLYQHSFLGLSEEDCEATWPLAAWLMLFRTAFAEIILCVRTWAIWNRHNVVSVMLLITMVAFLSLQCFLNYHYAHSLQFAPPPYLGFLGCAITGVNRIFLSTQYASLLTIEILLLTLVVVSAFRFYRLGRNSELSFIVHRDGILFYLYLLLLTGANVIITFAAPLDLVNTMIPLEDVLHSVFTTRIILNIRSAANHGQRTELHTSYFETRIRPTCLYFMSREHVQGQSISDKSVNGDRNTKDSHSGHHGAGTM